MTPGIMFHHFHSKNTPSSPGSLDKEKFKKIIVKLKKKFILLSAEKYLEKLQNKSLKEKETFLSFDDALKCQKDIAIPVLKEMDINGFFFVYTSIYDKYVNRLELYRDFRYNYFVNIDKFYEVFFQIFNIKFPRLKMIFQKKFNKDYLSQYSYYSLNDKKFRHMRNLLGNKKYNFLMDGLLKKFKYNINRNKKKLLMSKIDLKNLSNLGHIIGLHSHNHFTDLDKKSYQVQLLDLSKNKNILEKIINKNINIASYPCGNYNTNSIKVLKKLRVDFAVRADNNKKISFLEIPRIDHTLLKL